MRWYIKFENDSIGPLTDSELRELANKGSINSATLVSSDGQTWLEAETIAGLSFQPTRPRLPTENGFEAKVGLVLLMGLGAALAGTVVSNWLGTGWFATCGAILGGLLGAFSPYLAKRDRSVPPSAIERRDQT